MSINACYAPELNNFFRSVPTVDLGKCLEGSIINHSNFACRHNVLIYNHMQNLCKNIMAVFLKMNDHNITQYTTHKMMAILKMMTNAEYNYYYTECAFPQVRSNMSRCPTCSWRDLSPSFSGEQVLNILVVILSLLLSREESR